MRRDKDRVKREVVVGSKERWTVKTLYPYCNVSMDIVAVNTFYESNASNVIEINTPEGGRLSWLAVNKDNIRSPDPHSGRRVVSLSKIHLLPQKYW